MKYIDGELTGTEVTMIKPRKNFKIHWVDIVILTGIAVGLGTALWYSWNFIQR